MCVSPGRQVLFPAVAGTPVLPADGGCRPRVPTEAEEGRPKSQTREHGCLPRPPPPPLPAKTRGLGLLRLLPGWGQRPQPPGERELPRNTGCKSSVRNKSVQPLHRLSPWLTFSHSSVTLHCPVRILELRRGRQNTAGPGRRHLPSALKPAESPSGQWPASRGDTCCFRQGPPRHPSSTQTQTRRCSVQAPGLGSDDRPDLGLSAGLPPTWPAQG